MRLSAWLGSQPIGALTHLSEKTGIPYRTLQRYAYGERTPTLDAAAAIKDATSGEVSFEDFVARPPIATKKKPRNCARAQSRRSSQARSVRRG